MNTWNNWGPAIVIILGYVIGLYFQIRGIESVNKRLDDFKEALYKYLGSEKEGLYKYLGSEFASIGKEFAAVRTELRTEVKRLEDKIDHLEHPAAKPR